MATNQQRKQHQRYHLLQTAQRLFMRDGFKATKVSAIAAAAGVSQVTLYKYFDSKLSLGHQVVLAMVNDGYAASRADAVDPQLSYQELVQKMITMSTQITDNLHPDFYRFIVQDMRGQLGTDETMQAYQAQKRNFWSVVIRRGREAGMISPELTDDALMLYLDMFIQYVSSDAGQKIVAGNEHDPHFQALTRQIDHLFFYGFIGVPPTDTKEGLPHE
ncbi:TetR/AcrR family transcriptional regulator [Levilactobacillus acidifarinae]|uniref:TetR family transcriptional regulator n=1 Tax=Levilactobacillus acidifarinae DSM 19394 = JCM 15949 TaxID=1423715 RepID=A0A0R1LIT3_9LACO|nr:TetR/AcrR family transcriptional regulator [Levilactobacillus acidifarinae]KRK95741.1 TetR family transcriptional regulator [Levilactobacillus acidifarinae DSM 19394]GEO69477.1 TetR family transcriptional regulator [Levilactobacillus acidifarinae]